MWRHNLNTNIHSYYGNSWTSPFDEHFHLVLNVAIGGWFLDGPDPDDVWTYPEAEMWVDSVTVWPLEYIIDESQTSCETSDKDRVFTKNEIIRAKSATINFMKTLNTSVIIVDQTLQNVLELIPIFNTFLKTEHSKLAVRPTWLCLPSITAGHSNGTVTILEHKPEYPWAVPVNPVLNGQQLVVATLVTTEQDVTKLLLGKI